MELLKKLKKSITKSGKSNKETMMNNTTNPNTLPKSNSWPPWCCSSPQPATSSSSSPMKRRQQVVTPGGCFSVYVGPERQRFVMKAKYANHPLFKMLLEDAEQQYGYNSEGPLWLPCDVDLFYKVLAEMDSDSTDKIRPHGCGIYGSCSLLSPSRLIRPHGCGGGYGSYSHLSPSKLLKMNEF